MVNGATEKGAVMRYPRRLNFTLRMHDGTVLEVGYLPWPFGVRCARIVGDVVEVFDTNGSATFSLDDVYLSDLEVSR